VLVTICTGRRRRVLTVGAMPAILLDAIRSTSAGRPIKTHAWCVMPDHMHAVVAPTPGGDVVDWVQTFKGSVAADARRLGLRGLWQRSFHDRAVRSDEATVTSFAISWRIRCAPGWGRAGASGPTTGR
jgi:REP element-mobilizing transposase RayT